MKTRAQTTWARTTLAGTEQARAIRSLVVMAILILGYLAAPGAAHGQAPEVDPDQFVEHAYRDLLGRPPEPGGRNHWTGLLRQGERPRVVLASIGDSEEHRQRIVTTAYQRILRRPPEDDGLRWWADTVGDTLTLTGLRASLFASEEHRARIAEGTNEGMVRALYHQVLGREPEDEGLRYWTRLLDEGATPRAVATAVLESPEALLQSKLSILRATPAAGQITTGIGTISIRLDWAVVADASDVRVMVANEPLAGQVSAGGSPDTLEFRAAEIPIWVQPGSTVPVILTVLGYDGNRVGRVDYTFQYQVPPVQPISTFTTPLVPGQPRNNNIHLAADYIDGDVISAGSTYSLNQGIGRRTGGRGFDRNGFIDEDGEIISVTGGGVSQMGTTFLNAAWLAGIDLVDFRPHTIWFERYPMCREATLAWNQLDVVVTNDTPYDITIDTSHTPSSVTVSFIGVPWAEVDSWIGMPFDTGGVGGPFSVRCGRTLTYPDGSTFEDSYVWRYNEGYPG